MTEGEAQSWRPFHFKALRRALHAHNKLEQDERIFPALHIGEIQVAAGETSAARRALMRSERWPRAGFYFSLERENEDLYGQTRETQMNYGKLRGKRKAKENRSYY